MSRIEIHYQIQERAVGKQLRRATEDVFNFNCPSSVLYERTWRPPVDIYETVHEIVIMVDLAGTKRYNIYFELDRSNLLISGTRQIRHAGVHPRYHLAEISYGSFERILLLPCAVDKNTVRATYHEGLLKIWAAKLSPERAQKIKITQK